MSDDLVKRLRDFDPHLHEWEVVDEAADRIEALTEQLEAARHDAKEAEAYAEELQGDLTELCRQIIAAEDKLATCEKYRDAYDKMGRIGTEAYRELEAKLAKTVELVTFASNMDVTDWSEALDVKDQARTTLAEIEGEKG